jgi:hypothetical protein
MTSADDKIIMDFPATLRRIISEATAVGATVSSVDPTELHQCPYRVPYSILHMSPIRIRKVAQTDSRIRGVSLDRAARASETTCDG